MRQISSALTIVLAAASAWAQGKPVCSLLTASDVAAVGATGAGIETTMPMSQGPTKGESLKLCNWRLTNGGLHLSIARVPPGTSRESLTALLNQSYGKLKAKGWTEEKKDFGNISCSAMTPPPGSQDDPATTGCLTETKGMMISIATLSKTKIPMEKAKALVESAAGRL